MIAGRSPVSPEERAELVTRLEGITEEAIQLENARLMFVAGALYAANKAIDIVKGLGD